MRKVGRFELVYSPYIGSKKPKSLKVIADHTVHLTFFSSHLDSYFTSVGEALRNAKVRFTGINACTCCYRDAWHVTASLHQRVHNVMIQLDSAVASQVLQVAHVNVVRLASGTIVKVDACVSPIAKILKFVQAVYKFLPHSNCCNTCKV